MGWEIIYSIYWPPSPPGQRKRCFWTWGPTGSCSSCRAMCTPAQWCWAWSCCCTFCPAPPSEGDLKKACLQVPGWNAAPRAWTSWWVSVWPSPGDRVPPVNEHLPGLRGLHIACCSVTLTLTPSPTSNFLFQTLPHVASLLFRCCGLLSTPQSLLKSFLLAEVLPQVSTPARLSGLGLGFMSLPPGEEGPMSIRAPLLYFLSFLGGRVYQSLQAYFYLGV